MTGIGRPHGYGIPPDMEFGNYQIKGGCEDTSYLVSLLFSLLLIYLVIQTDCTFQLEQLEVAKAYLYKFVS